MGSPRPPHLRRAFPAASLFNSAQNHVTKDPPPPLLCPHPIPKFGPPPPDPAGTKAILVKGEEGWGTRHRGAGGGSQERVGGPFAPPWYPSPKIPGETPTSPRTHTPHWGRGSPKPLPQAALRTPGAKPPPQTLLDRGCTPINTPPPATPPINTFAKQLQHPPISGGAGPPFIEGSEPPFIGGLYPPLIDAPSS